MRRFYCLPLLALGLIVLLAGCTQPGTSGDATPTPAPLPTLSAPVDMTSSQHVTIKIIDTSTNVSGFWYDEPSIKIKVGTTVTWVNASSAAHTITSGEAGAPDGKFDSGQTNLLLPHDQGAASTFAFTFQTPGTYPYYCALHPAMIGQVQVVA